MGDAAQNNAKTFAESILRETVPIAGSDGMSVLENVVMLESTGRLVNVVLRKITMPFWQACIDLVDTPERSYRVCAVGSPGIGKTTCTPVLIRMLLKRQATVVYLIRSVKETDFYYEFIPNANGSVTANVYPEKEGESNIESLKSESTYYVVDPGETKDTCNPSITFQAKVIIVASPDTRHWGDSEFLKGRWPVQGFFRFFPVWELSELLAARTFFPVSIAEEEVVSKRYSELGGVPRYIFADQSSYNAVLKQQRTNINALTWEQVEKIGNNEVDYFDSMSPLLRKGALLAYVKSPNDNDTFEEDTVALASVLVEQKVYTKFKKKLWTLMLMDGPEGWKMFEAIARESMSTEQKQEFVCRPCVGKKNSLYNKTFRKMLGGCASMRLVGDIFESAKAENNMNVLLHSANRNNRLIDFIYRDEVGHFHAFQATIRKTHPANQKDIHDLETKVGDPKRLSLYYLVPSDNFKTLSRRKLSGRQSARFST